MKQGFIKLWRSMLETPLWDSLSVRDKMVAVTILLLAAWQDRPWVIGGKERVLHRGELYITAARLAERCGSDVTERQVRTSLSRLQDGGFLSLKRERRGTLISVTEWDKYQGQEEERGSETGENREKNGSHPVSDPVSDVVSPYNKKKRREENKKGNIYSIPTVDEVREEVKRCHYTFSADAFHAYYAGRNWQDKNNRPVKDWKSRLAMWQNNAAFSRTKPAKKKTYTMEDYAKAMKEGENDDLSWI